MWSAAQLRKRRGFMCRAEKSGPFKAEQCPGHEPSREWLLEIYGDHRRKICVFLIFE